MIIAHEVDLIFFDVFSLHPCALNSPAHRNDMKQR